MPNERWLKAVPNVSMADVKKAQQEKAQRELNSRTAEKSTPVQEPAPTAEGELKGQQDWLTGQPVNQSVVNQLTSVVNQLTSPEPSEPLVNQLTSQPVNQRAEVRYRSRRERKLKGIRLPVSKLDKYEVWCLLNKIDFQEAVEFALDWLTSQPVNQLTGQPVNQLTTLINNDLNNELIINDEKAKKVLAYYTKLTGKQPTTKDREAYREVAHLDAAVIQSGLETAIQRAVTAGSRVNSFKYALNCIHEAAKTTGAPAEGAATTGAEAVDASQCPDCKGTGFWYPEGPDKGVAKCPHAGLAQPS